MQPMQAPRIEILCLRCLALRASLFLGVRRGTARCVVAAAGAGKALPSAEEAVGAVEALLGIQPTAASSERASRGWRRLFNWRAR